MTIENFDQTTLSGDNASFQQAADELHEQFGFDFVALGLTAFVGAPLRWIYAAGATNSRHKRIALVPGQGIGGIVIKTGKPMLFHDVEAEINPSELSSYPIVFAEGIRSFCCLPLVVGDNRVIGAVLCAFRTVNDAQEDIFCRLFQQLKNGLLGMSVLEEDFLELGAEVSPYKSNLAYDTLGKQEVSRIVEAQEEERKRISRKLHDGIAQEILAVTFLLQQARMESDAERTSTLIQQAKAELTAVLDELHNVSVELRPSTLDHFGLVSALRSQAKILESAYGTTIHLEANDEQARFNAAYETQVYRICQEAILNSCKYSGTDTILVNIEFSDGWLKVSISDAGMGFNIENPTIKGSGCGLSGMRERAALIGAILDIQSSPESGTEVVLVAHVKIEKAKEELA